MLLEVPEKLTVVEPPVEVKSPVPGRWDCPTKVTVPVNGPESVITPVAVVLVQGKLIETLLTLTASDALAWLGIEIPPAT